MGHVSRSKLLSQPGSYSHRAYRSSFEHMTWYVGKAEIREYLRELNRDKKVCKKDQSSELSLPSIPRRNS